MTPKKALAKWQRRLRLADWRIALSGNPPDEGDRSNVDMDVRIRSAVIRLRGDTPDSQIERQIVHELLHVVMSGMEDAFNAAKELTPKVWDEPGNRMWDRGCEFAIEAMCDALTDTVRADWGPSGEPWNTAFPP